MTEDPIGPSREPSLRAPCPICERPAFLDPPCTITDMRTGLTRVEQSINCTKCNTASHYKPGMSRIQQAAHKAKQGNGQGNGATLCRCGCGNYAQPGRPYLKGHKLEPVPPDVPPTPTIEEEPEPMSSPPSPPANPLATTWCPCKCGKPVPPGRQYAGRGCAGRAKKGVPIPPEVLARRSETIRAATAAKTAKAAAKTGAVPAPAPEVPAPTPLRVPWCETPGCGNDAQPGKSLCTPCLDDVQFIADPPTEPTKSAIFGQLGQEPEPAPYHYQRTDTCDGSNVLTYSPEIQEYARRALDGLRKAEQAACPYTHVASLASQHPSHLLRAAANLRDALTRAGDHE